MARGRRRAPRRSRAGSPAARGVVRRPRAGRRGRRLDRRHRRPAHAEVALDGARDGRRGDDLARQAAVLGVELDDAVHVGRRATDVDDDHVAGTRVLVVEAAREQLDAGEHDVGRRAADQVGEGPAAASVRLLRCLPPITWLRNISRIAARALSGASTPILGTTLSARTYGVRDPSSRAATSGCDSTLPATTTGPAHGVRDRKSASPSSTSALPPSVPPTSSTTSGSEACRSASLPASSPPESTSTTLPPLESATRRPASAVTSSSLPTTAIRSPPPALEQASTSASAAAGSCSVSARMHASYPSRTSPCPMPSGRVVGWLAVASRSPVSRSTSAALVKVEPKSTQTTGSVTGAARPLNHRCRGPGRGRRAGPRRSRCRR